MAKISKRPLPPDDPIFHRGIISVFSNGPAPPKQEPAPEALEDGELEDDED
jgi:hypothetical protein